ncbi:MAG: hypothetical protein AB1531_03875 [Chloroflexota bacterium]
MIKKVITYTLIIIAILSLIALAMKKIVLPALEEQTRNEILLVIAATSIVLSILANLNETIELVSRFIKNEKEEQKNIKPQPGMIFRDNAHGNIVNTGKGKVKIGELNINLPQRQEIPPLIISEDEAIVILRAINKNGIIKNESLDGYLAREHKYSMEKRRQIVEDLEEHGLIEVKSNITRITGKGKEYIH